MRPQPPRSRHRRPILGDRVRHIEGGFAFLEHRFLHQGFFAELNRDELALYMFLVLAADRDGMSFYGPEAILSACDFSPEAYLVARNVLIAKDLIAFDGRRFQVLSLPERPAAPKKCALVTDEDFATYDPMTIRTIIRRSLGLEEPEGRHE